MKRTKRVDAKLQMVFAFEEEVPTVPQMTQRQLDSVDLLYTIQTADSTCCLAVQAGMQYGIPSHHATLCPCTASLSGRRRVTCVYADYHTYLHARHAEVVADLRPKYTTTQDVQTPHELAQVLEQAEELALYAEQVIIIPKYDCIAAIPEKFLIGYSLSGDVPIEAVKGRRVHLFGGNWKRQIQALKILQEGVVSIDGSHLLNLAQKGKFYLPDGEERSLQRLGIPAVSNPRYICVALSVGAMVAKVSALYTGQELGWDGFTSVGGTETLCIRDEGREEVVVPEAPTLPIPEIFAEEEMDDDTANWLFENALREEEEKEGKHGL